MFGKAFGRKTLKTKAQVANKNRRVATPAKTAGSAKTVAAKPGQFGRQAVAGKASSKAAGNLSSKTAGKMG